MSDIGYIIQHKYGWVVVGMFGTVIPEGHS